MNKAPIIPVLAAKVSADEVAAETLRRMSDIALSSFSWIRAHPSLFFLVFGFLSALTLYFYDISYFFSTGIMCSHGPDIFKDTYEIEEKAEYVFFFLLIPSILVIILCILWRFKEATYYIP